MQLIKKVVVISMAFFALFSTCVSADVYDLYDIGLNNINIPDGYYACTRDECDGGFRNVLKSGGYTHQKWVDKVMLPQNLYICARDGNNNVINVAVTDVSTIIQAEDGTKHHKLIYDYNLAYDSSDIEDILALYRDGLVEQGIEKRYISRISWIDRSDSVPTPYVMSTYSLDGTYICEYRTIYNGNSVSISLSSAKPLKKVQLAALDEMVRSMQYNFTVDYTQAKQIARQNERVRIFVEEDSSDDSDFTLGLTSAFVLFVLVFSIYETTNRSRQINRSRRKSKTGKY